MTLRSIVTAESIPTCKFCTSTPLGNVLIYLKRHKNRLRGLRIERGELSKKLRYLVDLSIPVHVRDGFYNKEKPKSGLFL